jgi:hypothetical protein
MVKRRGRRAAALAAIAFVLGGCERASEPSPAVATRIGGPETDPGCVAASATTRPAVAAATPRARPTPFELMGTSGNEVNRFAVLRGSGRRLLTVREGDTIDGYTIAAIETDRVRIRGPDNAEQLLDAVQALPVTMASVPPASPSHLITQGINTDQSLPANVSLGPTGFDPNNGRQMGH